MKKIKYILILAVIAAAFGCLTGCDWNMPVNYEYKNADKYTAGDREISDRIEMIYIDYMSGDVKLTGADTQNVSIKETSSVSLDEKRQVHTWVDGTTLYVKYCASARGLDLNKLNKKLEITVPKDVKLNGLTVDVSSTDVNCSDIRMDDLNIDSSSGDITVACEAKRITIDVSSGHIDLTQNGECDSIRLDTSSGKINAKLADVDKFETHASSSRIAVSANRINTLKSRTSSGNCEFRLAEAPQKTDISASSGDVMLYLPENANLTADLSVSSGDIAYELPFSKSGKRYVCGNGSGEMKIETSSGDIILKAYTAE